MDMTNIDPLGNAEALATSDIKIGGDKTIFAPGRYKAVLEKFEHASNQAATNYTPTATLKVFDVISSANPEAQMKFAGKSIKCRNPFNTSNSTANEAHKASVSRLILLCGKMEAWKKFVAVMASAGQKISTGAMCTWINDNCVGSAVGVELEYQWNHTAKKQEAEAKGETYKPYFDHTYFDIAAKTEAVNPSASPAPAGGAGAFA